MIRPHLAGPAVGKNLLKSQGHHQLVRTLVAWNHLPCLRHHGRCATHSQLLTQLVLEGDWIFIALLNGYGLFVFQACEGVLRVFCAPGTNQLPIPRGIDAGTRISKITHLYTTLVKLRHFLVKLLTVETGDIGKHSNVGSRFSLGGEDNHILGIQGVQFGQTLTVPALFIMTRYFGSLPLLNKLVLTESQTPALAGAGGIQVPHQRISGDEVVGGGKIRPGMTGVVTRTGLRPAGNIEIDDQLIDVTSSGGFVEAGTTVRVLEVHGNMITVEPVEEQA